MQKHLEVKIDVYEKGFSTKTFRHQTIIPFENFFTKQILIETFEFVKQCFNLYNKGERDLQYGRKRGIKENEKIEKIEKR